MDKEMKDMFNAILEEMGRVETRICNKFEGRFDRIESTLEQMQHKLEARTA